MKSINVPGISIRRRLFQLVVLSQRSCRSTKHQLVDSLLVVDTMCYYNASFEKYNRGKYVIIQEGVRVNCKNLIETEGMGKVIMFDGTRSKQDSKEEGTGRLMKNNHYIKRSKRIKFFAVFFLVT